MPTPDELDRLAADDEFFVGYLDTPPKTKRFSLALGVALVLLAGGVAAAAATFQRHPGHRTAAWGDPLTGVFVQEPYAHVRFVDEDGAQQTALLVKGWKSGMGQQLAEHDGREITVPRGALFGRGDLHVYVLFGQPEPSEELAEDVRDRLADVEEEVLGEVELAGEIVDSKCFYGQMRPGDGSGHRPCAQLCIRGGIPPVLITRDAEGAETDYLVTTGDGGPAKDLVMSFLAEPVRVRGELRRRGDLRILRVTSIAR